ncbi:MAG TPA: ABC transporter ATP-binding protein [Acidimicrobiales bacterium]|nr:ABC transporter ATP-binding protein [Acidimicrobiales bacterium]
MAGWMAAGVDADSRIDREQARQVFRRTLAYMAPYRRRITIAGLLMVLSTGLLLAGPLLVRRAVDRGIVPRNGRVLDQAVIAYAVAATLNYLIMRTVIINVATAGENFLRDLRNRVFRHLLDLSMPFYDREKAGVIVSRMTSDIDSLSELVQFGLRMFVNNILMLVGVSLVLVIMSWQLFLVCLVSVPILVVASRWFKQASNDAYLAVRDGIAATLSRLQEGLAGVKEIQAFDRTDVEARSFHETNRKLFDAHMRSTIVAAWYLPVVDLAGVVTTALAVGVGGYFVHTGRASLGTVVAYILLLQNLFEPIQQLSQLFNMVQSAAAGLHKLYELLDTPVEVDEPETSRELPASGALEVEHVSFAYGSGDPVLSDVTLTVAPNERLALVGPTGAGKSTLAKLMARLYDPTRGTISFGGVDLRDASRESLRHRIVVVPQEGYLFDGTIRENIRLARSGSTDAEVVAAVNRIGAMDRFAERADARDSGDPLDTEVGERGARLSAGERQLVSLARAALVDPSVLVLDEATSSLDPGTEAIVENAMDALMAGRTTIVIAHRLSTASRCDRIGVVVDGRLVELDTHEALMARGGHYASLYEAWIGAQGSGPLVTGG